MLCKLPAGHVQCTHYTMAKAGLGDPRVKSWWLLAPIVARQTATFFGYCIKARGIQLAEGQLLNNEIGLVPRLSV